MERKDLNSVPIHKAHVHFYDYISEFPGQPKFPEFEDNHMSIQSKLKTQFLKSDPK